MNNDEHIEGVNLDRWKTTVEIAEMLGVTQHQAIRLAGSGELRALRTAGGAYLIDVSSARKYNGIRQGRGRPLSSDVSWAALWLLSGREVDWLDYHQMRRLRIKLSSITASDLIWQLRVRAKTEYLRINETYFGRARDLLTLTGVSSGYMDSFGLTESIGSDNQIEGYADKDVLAKFYTDLNAVNAGDANVVVHVIENAPFNLSNINEMPVAVVAADLAVSAFARDRDAGLSKMEELLVEWKNNS